MSKHTPEPWIDTTAGYKARPDICRRVYADYDALGCVPQKCPTARFERVWTCERERCETNSIPYGLAHHITPDEAWRLFEAVDFIADFFENGTPVHPDALYDEDESNTTISDEIIALRDAIAYDKR